MRTAFSWARMTAKELGGWVQHAYFLPPCITVSFRSIGKDLGKGDCSSRVRETVLALLQLVSGPALLPTMVSGELAFQAPL